MSRLVWGGLSTKTGWLQPVVISRWIRRLRGLQLTFCVVVHRAFLLLEVALAPSLQQPGAKLACRQENGWGVWLLSVGSIKTRHPRRPRHSAHGQPVQARQAVQNHKSNERPFDS